MKRRYRLRDQARFRQVRQAGVSFSHPFVILFVSPNDQPISRCGFVVSRRVGKAVERNRVRRRLSESVRLLWEQVEPGWDMVWIARPAINQAEFVDLQQVCVRLLRKASILNVAPPASRGVTESKPEVVSRSG